MTLNQETQLTGDKALQEKAPVIFHLVAVTSHDEICTSYTDVDEFMNAVWAASDDADVSKLFIFEGRRLTLSTQHHTAVTVTDPYDTSYYRQFDGLKLAE